MNIKRRSDDFEAEINIIPLVDVMLVLLIIFMITAPVLKTAFDVQLPKSSSAEVIEQTEEVPTISISSRGVVKINGMVVNSLEELENILSKLGAKEVIIEGDKNVDYGKVISVLDIVKKVGIERIGLASEYVGEK